MTFDLSKLRDQYHQSVAAFIQGDPDVQKPLWSRRDDVTLANPLGPPAKGFDAVCQVMDHAAFVRAVNGPFVQQGFFEREVHRVVRRFGNIAHVFSTYEGRAEADSTHVRGINSIQLIFDGTRWWVVSVYWQAESPGHSIPPQYLPNAARPE